MKGDIFLKNSLYEKPFVPEPKAEFPENTPLAMAYVPFQQWLSTYDENTAFNQGTIFPQLDFPFYGEEAYDSYE
jgi:hypothetical protein